jgi:signal transduction histidine kinase
MASKAEPRGTAFFAASWRLLAAAALLVALFELVASTRHFASALLLAGAAALLIAGAIHAVARDRRTFAAAAAAAPEAERRHGEAAALLDAVTVALFLLSPDGRIRLANRAARQLAGTEVARLGQIASLGEAAAARILALPVGGRQIVPLADGRNMLVWVGAVSTAGGGPQRVVSMQAVAGELDAVQVGAWHSMTRVLAHEMMNSLTPIASLSESLVPLLEAEGAAPAVAGAVDTIARQSRHLMSFVERYRSVVDLPEPARAPVDAAGLLARIAALLGEQLGARSIVLSLDTGRDCGTAQADADLLGQALLNLLHNASDALEGVPDGEIRLSCRRDGERIRFRVSDNGPGVAAERLDEIFVPFFTTKQSGAGIGLALARQIALAHGGTLEAMPNRQRGMRFTLSIPA